jgi:hypothetical protein
MERIEDKHGEKSRENMESNSGQTWGEIEENMGRNSGQKWEK